MVVCLEDMPGRRVDVVVYGAGYAGLYAAYRLLGNGKSVLVIEAEPGISHKTYYGGFGLDGMVYIDEEYIDLIRKLEIKYFSRGEKGIWVHGLYLLSSLASKVFELGGEVVVDTVVEPIFDISEDGFSFKGVMLSDAGDELTSVREIVYAENIIDATYNASFITVLSDRLKLELPINGYGVVSPGNREIVERTSWVLKGILAAGLAVAQLIGTPLPFPDIGPLLMSGAKAANLILKGFNPANNKSIMYPWII
jgi:ribulose 1,5-bisphosphate synthetase/thiazole synthase